MIKDSKIRALTPESLWSITLLNLERQREVVVVRRQNRTLALAVAHIVMQDAVHQDDTIRAKQTLCDPVQVETIEQSSELRNDTIGAECLRAATEGVLEPLYQIWRFLIQN